MNLTVQVLSCNVVTLALFLARHLQVMLETLTTVAVEGRNHVRMTSLNILLPAARHLASCQFLGARLCRPNAYVHNYD